jgi:predicted nucleic acid-binding protein
VTPVFVDTSAVLAYIVAKDENHGRARRAFEGLERRRAPLLYTSFVLVETYALLSRRLGLDAVREFRDDMAPLIEVVWVGEALHEKGLDLLLERRRRKLSLVDTVSFIAMRERGIDEAFAFDPHFRQEGFSQVE